MATIIGRLIYEAIAPKGSFEGRAFHLRFTPLALAQSMTGVVPITLFVIGGPEHLRIYALAFLAFKISLGALISATIISRFFPVFVSEKGLRARNFWGLARVVSFEEVERIAPIQWLFFTPFLRISTRRTRHIVWLPRFLVNQEDFEAHVRRFAPKNSVLRTFFEP